jgi:hypothetical protein
MPWNARARQMKLLVAGRGESRKFLRLASSSSASFGEMPSLYHAADIFRFDGLRSILERLPQKRSPQAGPSSPPAPTVSPRSWKTGRHGTIVDDARDIDALDRRPPVLVDRPGAAQARQSRARRAVHISRNVSETLAILTR